MDYLGKAIKHFREEKRMTMGQLAAFSRLSVSTISAIEKGTRGKRPGWGTLDRIAKALEKTTDELLAWRPDPGLEWLNSIWDRLPDHARHKIEKDAKDGLEGADRGKDAADLDGAQSLG